MACNHELHSFFEICRQSIHSGQPPVGRRCADATHPATISNFDLFHAFLRDCRLLEKLLPCIKWPKVPITLLRSEFCGRSGIDRHPPAHPLSSLLTVLPLLRSDAVSFATGGLLHDIICPSLPPSHPCTSTEAIFCNKQKLGPCSHCAATSCDVS